MVRHHTRAFISCRLARHTKTNMRMWIRMNCGRSWSHLFLKTRRHREWDRHRHHQKLLAHVLRVLELVLDVAVWSVCIIRQAIAKCAMRVNPAWWLRMMDLQHARIQNAASFTRTCWITRRSGGFTARMTIKWRIPHVAACRWIRCWLNHRMGARSCAREHPVMKCEK